MAVAKSSGDCNGSATVTLGARLLQAQRASGIDVRGAARGDPGRERCYEREHGDCDSEYARVAG